MSPAKVRAVVGMSEESTAELHGKDYYMFSLFPTLEDKLGGTRSIYIVEFDDGEAIRYGRYNDFFGQADWPMLPPGWRLWIPETGARSDPGSPSLMDLEGRLTTPIPPTLHQRSPSPSDGG